MALNASFFDIGKKPFQGNPKAFPLRSATGKDLQLYGADYVLNSLAVAAWQTKNTLNITELLSKVNVTVTTKVFEKLLPEMVKKYGEDKEVEILANLPGTHAPFG